MLPESTRQRARELSPFLCVFGSSLRSALGDGDRTLEHDLDFRLAGVEPCCECLREPNVSIGRALS